VQAIYVFSERNPVANVVRFHLGPRSGAARVQTSIRLAAAQRITVVARMNDGSLWSGGADVIVTQNACLDDS
jgi:sulfur-oxidizing protein SoxY